MAQTKHKEMDMLHGGLAGKLILFALPLAFSSILQQLFNSADVAVVGRFAGDTALAAVGSCVALVGIFVNLIVGLSVGPNAVLALLIGQNNREEINRTLHTVITFGAALGVGLMIVGWLTAKPILVLSGTPESVLDQALLYIFIYFLSIPFMLVYNFGSAVLRSYGDSRRPMYYLLISGTVNVILNLFLVIALQLGVAGVAIATVISHVLTAGVPSISPQLRVRQTRDRLSHNKIHCIDSIHCHHGDTRHTSELALARRQIKYRADGNQEQAVNDRGCLYRNRRDNRRNAENQENIKQV